METMGTDSQAKYQRLAAEYAKIRSQVGVLRKAVIDEQAKNSSLQEDIKEKEQSIRKVDQEMESLTFRNQQLMKRVSVLQDELDIIQKGKTNKAMTTGSSHQMSSVMDEELQNKISQNAQLMSLLQEQEDDHATLTHQLMERVQSLEKDLQAYQQSTSDVESKFKSQIDELNKEKLHLKEKVRSTERDLQQYSTKITSLLAQQDRMQTDLGSKLNLASQIIDNKLPFVDSNNLGLNDLNVPNYDRHVQTWCMQLICKVGSLVTVLTNQLSDFHTYFEQRIRANAKVLSPVAEKFSAHLKANARYLRGIDQGYKEFQDGIDAGSISLETLPSLGKLSSRLEQYLHYLQKLSPYLKLTLDEENSSPSSSKLLESINGRLVNANQKLTNTMQRLSNLVLVLSMQSKRSKQSSSANLKVVLINLIDGLAGLHNAVAELFSTFEEKSQLENHNEQFNSTNKCIINALICLVSTTKELHSLLEVGKAAILESALPSRKSHPIVAEFKARACAYLKGLEEEEQPMSVPYEEALKHREESLGGSKSREVLAEQLATALKKAMQLEQDKEHWKHEYQLLQMKNAKEQKELQPSGSGAVTPLIKDDETAECQNSQEIFQQSPESSGQPFSFTGMLGQVISPIPLLEIEARETKVKTYFMGRINQLVADRQLAEGKASSFKAECMSLHERLQLAVEQKSLTEQQMSVSGHIMEKLQGELLTTTTNYETQLSMMSEHLANMNEKLTVQKDEIDQLNYQLKTKGKK